MPEDKSTGVPSIFRKEGNSEPPLQTRAKPLKSYPPIPMSSIPSHALDKAVLHEGRAGAIREKAEVVGTNPTTTASLKTLASDMHGLQHRIAEEFGVSQDKISQAGLELERRKDEARTIGEGVINVGTEYVTTGEEILKDIRRKGLSMSASERAEQLNKHRKALKVGEAIISEFHLDPDKPTEK